MKWERKEGVREEGGGVKHEAGFFFFLVERIYPLKGEWIVSGFSSSRIVVIVSVYVVTRLGSAKFC